MKRDKGIDFLMFVAILMVVNSHLEEMYVGGSKLLATGGVLGDALFFFCSGYKLFLGKMDRFDNWYKRRIVRIYPSVIVFDVLAALILYLLSRSRLIVAIMGKRMGTVIAFLGSFCLKVYISSPYLQTEKYNQYFPLNILVFFIVAFVTAFRVRTITRFVVQTFNRDKPYDYQAILFK